MHMLGYICLNSGLFRHHGVGALEGEGVLNVYERELDVTPIIFDLCHLIRFACSKACASAASHESVGEPDGAGPPTERMEATGRSPCGDGQNHRTSWMGGRDNRWSGHDDHGGIVIGAGMAAAASSADKTAETAAAVAAGLQCGHLRRRRRLCSGHC